MLLGAGAWNVPAVVPLLQLFVDHFTQTSNADLAHAAEEGFLLFRDEVGSGARASSQAPICGE